DAGPGLRAVALGAERQVPRRQRRAAARAAIRDVRHAGVLFGDHAARALALDGQTESAGRADRRLSRRLLRPRLRLARAGRMRGLCRAAAGHRRGRVSQNGRTAPRSGLNMRPAIHTENLGKLYRIGAAPPGKQTLREAVAAAATAPLRRVFAGPPSGVETIW